MRFAVTGYSIPKSGAAHAVNAAALVKLLTTAAAQIQRALAGSATYATVEPVEALLPRT
jgi:hypothetical protein